MIKNISGILGVNVRAFLQDCVDFVNQHNQILIGYFSQGGSYPKSSFDTLDNLIRRYEIISTKISANRNAIEGLFNFEIVDQIESMRSVFRSFDNYARWLKSSVVEGRFVNSAEISYVLAQNQTIESFASDAGYVSREEGFLDLTSKNALSERSYDLNGGVIFKFAYQNDSRLELNSIVDNATGDNLLGKDISKKFEFLDDDLKVLSPRDTFNQTVMIFTGLTKNANPEFPTQGFNKDTISNRNLLNNMLPTFIRQMYALVSGDDTIASFSISDVKTEGDALRIEMNFESHLSYMVKQSSYGN